MADRYYGVEIGAPTEGAVTEDSSTTSKGVELVVDLAVVTTREQVILALEKLKYYLTKSNWPPA